MKPLFFSMLFVLSAACGGSDLKGESKDTKLIQVDGDDAETNSAACDQELALECAEGSVDGCGVTDEGGASLTLLHICVAESESAAGPACEQEIARVCDEGFVDACSLTPAAAATHLCVMQPAANDNTSIDPADLDTKGDDEGDDEGSES